MVVVGYVLNDSEDENAAEARRAADWLADRKPPPPRPLLDRSALLRVVRTRLWATGENRRRVEGFRSMYAPTYPGWVAAQKALRTMGGMCRERGVPFVVLIFPLFGNPLDDGYPFADVHAQVAQVAAEAGAKVVDLLPRLPRPALRPPRGGRRRDDEHPNEIAHRIAAQTLAQGAGRRPAGRGRGARALAAGARSGHAGRGRPVSGSGRPRGILAFLAAGFLLYVGLAVTAMRVQAPRPSTKARTSPPATPTWLSATTGSTRSSRRS